MAKQSNTSAGLLLFRRTGSGLEVFLAHPGGPFWARRDAGAWTIPKGLIDPGEDPLAAARREFGEETGLHPAGPFLPLGNVRLKSRKVIHAWACEGDADPAAVTSNETRTEWPPKSGKWVTFPEIDRCAWFDPATARAKINAAQAEFLERLEALLPQLPGGPPPPPGNSSGATPPRSGGTDTRSG
ncbi:MAG: hydrolase [Gemmataceae bacterium]|nr:hydrolase [Gemmataceae bacterium]